MPLPAAEQAAPGWLPAVALLIPIAIMLAVLVPALRRRGRAKTARRAQAGRRAAAATELGSAARIEDPSAYSAEALLKALAIRPEDHGPTANGAPHDEGWAGTMLGLKSKISYATELLEPHVFWGTRAGRQVFIRVGPDERIAGGTTMLSNRHVRSITVLRVEAPRFEIVPEGGELRPGDDSPPALRGLIGGIAADRVAWPDDALVVGGPQGIVAARSAIDGVGYSFAYDLWLCERIAGGLALPALRPARIGPAWKVPYGLGRSLTPQS